MFDTYLISFILSLAAAAFLGFLLGRPYWFSKGFVEGIEHGGDIWRDTLGMADEIDTEYPEVIE